MTDFLLIEFTTELMTLLMLQLCEHGLLTRRTLLPAPWQRFSSSYCALDLAYLVQVVLNYKEPPNSVQRLFKKLFYQGIEAEHQLRARVLRLQQLRRLNIFSRNLLKQAFHKVWCHFACFCALVQSLGKAQGRTCISSHGGGARKKRWLETS